MTIHSKNSSRTKNETKSEKAILPESSPSTTPEIRRGFGSDNHAGVHPQIMQAILNVNLGHMPSYQTDSVSASLEKKLKLVFGQTAKSFLVFNGTAANVLGLSALVKSYQSVLVSDVSHLENDECGAPEKLLGIKLRLVQTSDAKLTPKNLLPHILRRGDQHHTQVAAISITQPTELGTVYTLLELREIVAFAKEHRLLLHLDGARLANAAAKLQCGFQEICQGFDIVSFGGTKNGCLGVEAVVVVNSELGLDMKYFRKQFLNLPSKTRFLAAQLNRYLEGEPQKELWRELALHSLQMAQLLRLTVEKNTNWNITQKTDSNAVFVCIPKEHVKRIKEHYFFYIWNEETFEARLMTSWDTTPEDISGFGQLISGLT
jgi:threonine aldolase